MVIVMLVMLFIHGGHGGGHDDRHDGHGGHGGQDPQVSVTCQLPHCLVPGWRPTPCPAPPPWHLPLHVVLIPIQINIEFPCFSNFHLAFPSPLSMNNIYPPFQE